MGESRPRNKIKVKGDAEVNNGFVVLVCNTSFKG